ncbi:MAG: hypothetical protein DI563_05375 [Variovorax paradoxus]|uniref:Uncharacterized protein n=1 Tax=Variovorax paradoxus TaxID=34073 RepID=A0A2W5S2N2_VARPD|nr:MAG: hypothetical protein DI563_05375 [Variovorax paradoxus]
MKQLLLFLNPDEMALRYGRARWGTVMALYGLLVALTFLTHVLANMVARMFPGHDQVGGTHAALLVVASVLGVLAVCTGLAGAWLYHIDHGGRHEAWVTAAERARMSQRR